MYILILISSTRRVPESFFCWLIMSAETEISFLGSYKTADVFCTKAILLSSSHDLMLLLPSFVCPNIPFYSCCRPPSSFALACLPWERPGFTSMKMQYVETYNSKSSVGRNGQCWSRSYNWIGRNKSCTRDEVSHYSLSSHLKNESVDFQIKHTWTSYIFLFNIN